VDLQRSELIGRPVGSTNSTKRLRSSGESKQYKLHQSPTINDCMYRHMYHFQRIAVFDFDEVSLKQASALRYCTDVLRT